MSDFEEWISRVVRCIQILDGNWRHPGQRCFSDFDLTRELWQQKFDDEISEFRIGHDCRREPAKNADERRKIEASHRPANPPSRFSFRRCGWALFGFRR